MKQELEKFIDSLLLKGDINDKTKELLIKKANQDGEDALMFEIELEQKINDKKHKVQSSIEQPIVIEKPKSEKLGDVKKCPGCGSIAQSFQTKCTDCGHEFRNIEVANSAQLFFQKLEEIENSREKSIFSGVFNGHADLISKKKAGMISNFPVPNSKDDLLEFLSLALPQAKVNTGIFSKATESQKVVSIAFKQKCEQIIMKARFSMKDDKKTLEEINGYAKEIGV